MAKGKKRRPGPAHKPEASPERDAVSEPDATVEPAGSAAPGGAASGAERSPGPSATGERSRRTKLIALAATVVLLAGAVIVAVAAGGGEDDSLQYADGVVVHSEEDRLVLRPQEPLDGQEQVEMTILPEDAASVDIEHLQYHQVQGDLFRIWYELRDGTYHARLAEDIPGTAH